MSGGCIEMSGDILGAVMALSLGLGIVVGAAMSNSAHKDDMVKRGLATYCPDTGAWAWVGECAQ